MYRAKTPASVNALIDEVVRRIRNPLNALLLNIDNLDHEIAENNVEHGRERLKRMRNTIAEMDSLVCEFLRLSELPKPRTATVDVNAVIRELETFARPEFAKRALNVRLQLRDNLPDIEADPIQIKQAVLNIILNAIENSPPRGSITLATGADADHVSIEIADEGAGIGAAHRERIFDPFFSTKEGGVGLGLALADKIAKLHHGRISFTSEVGKGSRFVIVLPLRQ